MTRTKRFITVTIIVLCLSAVMPWVCYPASLPAQEQGDAVKGADEQQDKGATTIQENDKDGSSDEKTDDKDRDEPEYDMDLEIDFKDERC